MAVRQTGERPKVYSVAIEVTPFCNQKCDYCYNEWREDGGAALETGSGDRIVARVRKLVDALDIDHVTLTGGEPLARPEAFRILDLLKERGISAQIISNGALVTDAMAERLSAYGLRYVQCTLNGATKELHDVHVGKGWFDKTLVGVRHLLRHGVPVVGCIVMTKKNAPATGDILELWHSLGVRQIALSRFSPAGYAAKHAAQLLPTRGELLTAFRQAVGYARDRAMSISCTMPVPPCAVEVEELTPIQFGTCPIGTSMQEFALGADGRLRNCTLHKTAIGGVPDILDDDVDLPALLGAPEVTSYRKRVPDFCQGCLHADTCGGGCGAAAEWVLGDARKHPDPFVLQHVDDDVAARFERERRDGKTHLEMIL